MKVFITFPSQFSSMPFSTLKDHIDDLLIESQYI